MSEAAGRDAAPGEGRARGWRRLGAFAGRAAMVLPFLLLGLIWEVASRFVPPYLVPPLSEVLGRTLQVLVTWEMLSQVLATVARTLGGLGGAFLLGGILAALMGRSMLANRQLGPLLTFLQGVPALSWVVFAVIWFRGIEPRIFFIMVVTTLPAFTFQLLDSYRAIPKDLAEMVLAYRPRRAQMLRVLVIPAVLPGILTAWKVNLGNASRVVVVAELVGATGGVGYELLQQQQLFDMAGAMAWTLQLVLFVLLVQGLIGLLEAVLLRWRPTGERSA